MLSNPMNAHGEITAIRTTCDSAAASGTTAGAIDRPRLNIAPTKQMTMPAANTSASAVIALFISFLKRMHSHPTPVSAATDSSTSPM